MSLRAGPAGISGMLVFGAAVLLLPSRSAADPAGDERARLPALREAGAGAAKARNWEACIDAYSRAAGIEEDAVIFGELGLCEEAAGRYASAHPHLKRAVAGLAPGDERRTRYQVALGHVAQQVAIVFLTVQPRDAQVVMDGRPLGQGDGGHVAVAPGRHVFTARLDGHEDLSRAISVNARETPNLQLTLTPKVNPVSLEKPHPSAVGPSRIPWYMPAWSPRGVLVPLAAATATTALASTAAAIGLAVHAQSMRDSLVARGYGSHTCRPGTPASETLECQEIYSRQLQRNSAIGVAVGTGIAAGTLIGLAGIAIAVEPLGPKVTATAGADGGGITLQGTW